MNKNRLFIQWRDGDKTTKRKVLTKVGLIFIVCFAVTEFLLANTLSKLSAGKYSTFYYMFKTATILLPAIVLALIFTFIIIYLFFNVRKENETISVDETGVEYKKKAVYGSARLLSQSEAKALFEVKDIKDTTNTIYGQFGEDGSITISRSDREENDASAKHCLLIGLSGSGKSWSFIMPNIVTAIKYKNNGKGVSCVITDPSMEIYKQLSPFARNEGYDVRIINMKHPEYSDCWSILQDTCINPATGRIDERRIKTFIDVLGANTPDSDVFFKEIALNIIKTLIGYVGYKKEQAITDNLCKLFKKIDDGKAFSDFFEKKDTASFEELNNDIRNIANEKGLNLFEIESMIAEIHENSSSYQFTIKEVVTAFTRIDAIMAAIKLIPDTHFVKTNYYSIQHSLENPTIKTSALSNVSQILSIFMDSSNSLILSNEGIHLANTITKKTIYFVCSSDSQESVDPVAALFFSFLFKTVMDQTDECNEEERKALLPLEVYLDEAPTVGKLYNWKSIMNDSRKRNIRIIAAYQYFNAIEGTYGKFDKDSVIANSTSILFFGGNDQTTLKFISEFCLGVSTVQVETYTESTYGNLLGTKTYNVGLTARPLMTEDECRRMKQKKVLVSQVGKEALLIDQLPLHLMPLYKQGLIKKCNYTDGVTPISEIVELNKRKHPENGPQQVEIMLDSFGKRIEEVELLAGKGTLEDRQKEINNFFVDNPELAKMFASGSKDNKKNNKKTKEKTTEHNSVTEEKENDINKSITAEKKETQSPEELLDAVKSSLGTVSNTSQAKSSSKSTVVKFAEAKPSVLKK